MDRRDTLRLRWRGEADAIGVCLAWLAWLLLPAWWLRLIQLLELSRLLWWLRLLRLGRDRGRAPETCAAPASKNRPTERFPKKKLIGYPQP